MNLLNAVLKTLRLKIPKCVMFSEFGGKAHLTIFGQLWTTMAFDVGEHSRCFYFYKRKQLYIYVSNPESKVDISYMYNTLNLL